MAKKKYDTYNSDLFDKAYHDEELAPETVHLKGTGVGNTERIKQESAFDKPKTDSERKEQTSSYNINTTESPRENIAQTNEEILQQENPIPDENNYIETCQLEDQNNDMNLNPHSLYYIAKNKIEDIKRAFMGENDEDINIEKSSNSPYDSFSSESKPRKKDDNIHHDEKQTLMSDGTADYKASRKLVERKRTGGYDTDSWRRSDFERKQKERAEKERIDFERKQKERAEKERREFERAEKERKEKERREFERAEKERKERERQEKEQQKKREFEHEVLNYSENIPVIPKDYYFALYTEKKDGLGEDSMPLIFRSRETACVGVFDGMGGAGAKEYPTLTIGNKTGAYLASRVVRAVSLNWLLNNGYIDELRLKEDIIKYFNYLLSIWNVSPSGLRSGFVRVLPTTLAIVEATSKGNKTEVTSYWAGDSRNYVLLASGLKQLSTDDLRQPKDPLENLRSDDALSNCICQDKPFEINVKKYNFKDPIIILSATDGCFGYLLTPMHFEYILLDCMMKSSNCDEWSIAIRQSLTPISSDDFTIGLQIVDGDYDYWKNLLRGRYEYLKESVIMPIEQMKSAHEKAMKECAICEQNLYYGITEFWNQYKEEFMLTNQSYRYDN